MDGEYLKDDDDKILYANDAIVAFKVWNLNFSISITFSIIIA